MGHIRTSPNCDRHKPQPLQFRAVSMSAAGDQLSCNLIGLAVAGRRSLLQRPRPPAACAPNGRRFSTIEVFSSATILPGFRMPAGSKIRFRSRNT